MAPLSDSAKNAFTVEKNGTSIVKETNATTETITITNNAGATISNTPGHGGDALDLLGNGGNISYSGNGSIGSANQAGLYATNSSSIGYIATTAKAFATNWQYLLGNIFGALGLMFAFKETTASYSDLYIFRPPPRAPRSRAGFDPSHPHSGTRPEGRRPPAAGP